MYVLMYTDNHYHYFYHVINFFCIEINFLGSLNMLVECLNNNSSIEAKFTKFNLLFIPSEPYIIYFK